MKDETSVKSTFEDGWEDGSATVNGEDQSQMGMVTPGNGEHGPCLFLGPAGERCTRGALDDGFCATHQAGGIAKIITAPARVFAAVVTIVVLLWPYIADMVREIIRWMATH